MAEADVRIAEAQIAIAERRLELERAKKVVLERRLALKRHTIARRLAAAAASRATN
ncbi:hypothetical protein FRB99_001226 [Tulasnella sp. 403]|nr:hypothetical protein FRB99_001226 [Tulasnella sp. 403]